MIFRSLFKRTRHDTNFTIIQFNAELFCPFLPLSVCVLVELCSTLFTTLQCHTHSNRIYCVSSSQPEKSELDFIFNGIGEGVLWVCADGNRVKCQEFLCFWNCRTLGRLFVHKSQHTIFIPFVAHIHHREISFALFSLSDSLSVVAWVAAFSNA